GAFLYSGAQLVHLRPMTRAYGINDSGQVAGIANGHPAYWLDVNGNNVVDGSELIDLGTFGGATTRGGASAINGTGLLVGNTGVARQEMGFTLQHAFKWQAGTSTSSIQDLNGLNTAPFVLRQWLSVSATGLIAGYGSSGTSADPSSIDKAYLLKPN